MKIRWGIVVAFVGAALLGYVWIQYKLIPAHHPVRPDPNFLPGELALLSIALLIAGAILTVVSLALNRAQRGEAGSTEFRMHG